MICFVARSQLHREQINFREVPDLSYVIPPQEILVDSLQRLNLILPEGVDHPPLLMWIGGGAWSFVNRDMEMDLCRKFAREGIAVASVGHRLSKGEFSPQRHSTGVKHPSHIEDVASAFKWLYDNSGSYGYDSENIFVAGYSSGAYLAALLGMDEEYLKAHGLKTSSIRGLIPVSGTFDIVDYHAVFYNHADEATRELAETHVKDVFGEEDGFEEALPTNYIKDLRLPMLLISDNALYNYTKFFEEKLSELNYSDFKVYHERHLNHGELWRGLSNSEDSKVRDLMLQFIYEHTQ